jgi:hypothetical protein
MLNLFFLLTQNLKNSEVKKNKKDLMKDNSLQKFFAIKDMEFNL